MNDCTHAPQRAALCVLLLWSWLAVNAPFAAEIPAAVNAEQLTAEERRELLGKLSDEQVRELMLEMWGSDAARVAEDSHGMMMGFQGELQTFRSQLADILSQWPRLGSVLPYLFDQLIPAGQDASFIFWMVIGCLAIFAIAAGVERMYLRGVARYQTRLMAQPPQDFTAKLKSLSLRLSLRVLGLVIFTAVAVLAWIAINPKSEPVRLAVLTYVAAVVCFRLIAQLSRFLLAPTTRSHRLIPFECHDAQRMHRWILGLGGVGSFGLLTLELLESLGLDEPLARLLGVVFSSVFATLLITAIWMARPSVSRMLRTGDNRHRVGGWFRNTMASGWPVLLTLLMIVIYASAVYGRTTGFASVTSAAIGTLLIVFGFPLIGAAIDRCIKDRARRAHAQADQEHAVSDDTSRSPDEAEARAGALARPLIVLGLSVSVVLLLGWLWEVDFFSMRESTVGGILFDAAVQILIALILAYVVWLFIVRAIAPHMPDEHAPSGPGDEGGGKGASRVSTLMPLLRKFALFTIVVVTTMVVLSALGVNIGPLIASAGVIGIAIGFGAQSLVRDVISGLFFLMDDAFRKGEYIETENIRGTVESISVRSFQLRHHNGPIHTIPYGEIKSITNYSRDWAIMKFEIRIPFEADIDLVRRLIKKVGQKMMRDEEFGPLLLEPLKSQGVNRMDDSALIVRCKFTAIPGQQFYVRREAFRRIQEAFAEQGIQFAPRRVIVETTTPGSVAEGAAAVLDEDKPAEGKAASDRG